MEHDLVFGSFLTPSAERPERVVDLARLTEQVGLDLVGIQDHPYQARFLDTWTLLSVIAARTSRITVTPNVANLPLRPPAVLARSVATLDLLSQGRVELGLGAGGFFEAIAAIGRSRRLDARRAVDALEEVAQQSYAPPRAAGDDRAIDGGGTAPGSAAGSPTEADSAAAAQFPWFADSTLPGRAGSSGARSAGSSGAVRSG